MHVYQQTVQQRVTLLCPQCTGKTITLYIVPHNHNACPAIVQQNHARA